MSCNNPTGHPVMGEIAPRRTAVFIGQTCPKSYIGGASFPLICNLWHTFLSYAYIHAYPMKTAVRLGPIAPLPNVFFKNDQMTEWPLPKKHINIFILNALRNQKRSFFEWPFTSQKVTFHQKTKNFGIAHKYFEHRSHLIFHFTMSKFSIQKTYPFFRVWHPDIIPKSSRYHSEGMQSPKTDNK